MNVSKNITILVFFCFLYTHSQIEITNRGKDNEIGIEKNIDTLNHSKIKKENKVLSPSKPELKRSKVKLLITRAGESSFDEDIKNSWISALTEAYFYFQFHNYESCEVIPRKEFLKALKPSDGFGIIIPKNTICQAAESVRASHVLVHNYKYNKNGSKRIEYSIELVNPKNKTVIMSGNTNFHPDSIDIELRSFTEKILEKLNITLTERENEILKRPVFSINSTVNRNFGKAMVGINDNVNLKTAQKILKFARNDPDFGLAAFKAAEMYEALKDYTHASHLYSQVILRNGFYTGRLYIKAAKNYRERESYDQALRILSLSEKKGIKTVDIYLEKAINYEKSRKHLNARECYEEILKLDPNQPDAILFIAKVKREDELYLESLELLSRISPKSSNIALFNLEKGENYLALGKDKEALVSLQSALKLLPENPRIHTLLGEINFKLKKYQTASIHFKTAFEKQPDDLGLLIKTSDTYKMTKQFQKALDMLKKHKSNFYDSKLADREIGLLKFYTGDTTGARSILETCINMKPPDSSVFMILGDIYASAGKQEKAISMYERAEPLVKDTFSIKLALANLYLIKKEYQNAENRFRSIISAKPKYPQVNRYLADILFIKNRKTEALGFYIKERMYNGDDIYVQQKIAKLYCELNDLVNAKKETEKLVKLDQSNVSGYFQLSIIAVKQKIPSDAKRYYAKGESLGKTTMDNYLTLGEGFASIGIYDKAIDAYNKGLKTDSSDEKVLIELGKLYMKTKQDSMAAKTFIEIYNINNIKNSHYLGEAGHIYYQKLNKEKAYSLYSKYIEQGFKDPIVSINLAEMEFDKKQYEKTISLLKDLEEKYLSDTRAVKMLALSYSKTGAQDLTIPSIEKLLAQAPDDINIIEMAAIAYEKKGNLSSAVKMYKKFLTFPKTDTHQNYAYHLATLYEKMNNKSQAMKQYTLNTKVYPNDFRNYINLTEYYVSEKKYSSAVDILIKATKRPSCPPELLKKLANIYDLQNKRTQAGAIYEQYLKIAPQDYEVWNTLGSLYFSQNKYNLAIAPLETSIKHIPNESSNYYKLGYSFYKTKQFGKAVNHLQKALAFKSDSLEVLLLLFQCYSIERDTTNLIEILKERIFLNPKNYKLHLEIGELFLSTKQYEAAIKAFETAENIMPGDVKV
ncbi:MAG: tetratricopeptide repeat protein, partial [Chitinispirillia bacterium]